MAGYCQIARHKGGCERDGDIIKREDQSQSADGGERETTNCPIWLIQNAVDD